MKKNAEAPDRQGKVEKKCIQDMLKENDCETLEELKNLITFLNNENKRLHSVNIESLKKINILTVRVRNLESLAKNYDKFYQNGKSYKDKLDKLSQKVNVLLGYAKDKHNECCELIGEQDKYFRNFFANLNKIIQSIVLLNPDGEQGEGSASPRASNPLDGESYLQREKTKGSSSACTSDNDQDDNNRGCANSEDEEKEIHKKSSNYLTITRERTHNRMSTHGETCNHPDMCPLDELRMKEQDRCNERIEKIKSLCESFRNIDNDSSKSGNSHEKFENENMHKYQLENDEDIKFIQSADKWDGKIREKVTYKKINGTKVDVRKRLEDIEDYDKDIKKRLDNLVNDISSSKEKKQTHDMAAKNTSNKIPSVQSNIMDILNNRMSKASLEHIESSSTPKYVKYNTIHREIMNPRQHLVNQNKNSVDHIICL
ncbi:Uncharacterized protein PKNOH_S120154500 [Plasmodium knowlesi]|uniref:Uncharacterized protein n=1 Tax=Plasmodium knowlesi TaxID=5850 RepID=A0A1Y3DPS3_PLAKN|nr:Uncharacterized protein PKNOH_S120154500 [Plasmodium knowlesi]